MAHDYDLITNYIYCYHTDKFVVIPTYPESIQDNMNSSFQETSILSRSAPVFSYTSSGPRSVNIQLRLHRDLMTQLNYSVSNINLDEVDLNDDYVDTIIKQLQACAVPVYAVAEKMVNPPMVAVRFGEEIYIKGVVQGGVSVTYELPLLANNKYAVVTIGMNIVEVDPYDAHSIMVEGSFRGINKTLERRIYKS